MVLRQPRGRSPALLLGLMLALLLGRSVVAATPAYLEPEVLNAALAMNLTDAQQARFQAVLATLADGRQARLERLRAEGAVDVASAMQAETTALMADMDAAVAEFLTETQQAPYRRYRDLLQHHMNQQEHSQGTQP